jgi:hypothetical protein
VKAEAAKLPGAGIGPKQCPENEWQKKATYRTQGESSNETSARQDSERSVGRSVKARTRGNWKK